MGAGVGQLLDVPVGRDRAYQQADLQQASRLARGVAHGAGLDKVQRHRRLAEDVLAVRQGRQGEPGMQRRRQADVDGVDVLVFNDRAHLLRVTAADVDQFDVRHGRAGRRVGLAHRAGAEDRDPGQTAASAWSRSARMSSMCSSPTDSRT
jgi:hypothetical protein